MIPIPNPAPGALIRPIKRLRYGLARVPDVRGALLRSIRPRQLADRTRNPTTGGTMVGLGKTTAIRNIGGQCAANG